MEMGWELDSVWLTRENNEKWIRTTFSSAIIWFSFPFSLSVEMFSLAHSYKETNYREQLTEYLMERDGRKQIWNASLI